MQCDMCHKNESTIHIQEIVNGQKKTLHICAQCAASKSQTNSDFDVGGFNLAEMLYNLSEKLTSQPGDAPGKDGSGEPESKINSVKCPGCGWDLQGLRKSGRLGCAECYKTFSKVIEEALENMHRGKLHVGKKPGADKNDESPQLMMAIMSSQKELEEVIQREEYEKAAELRDKIAELKKKIEKK